ncbi:MAG: response regulator transcription factor [Alphaproteobacteria bacterium]|nr:response regulator transcription factor [Alphaproteobacteria bacterium]
MIKKTVLIIDDDDALRNTLVIGLRNAGFCVLDANGADSGKEILKRISVDAIVLDRMMVGTDGLSFLKQLRAAGNDTPVIMLTAMTGSENAIDGLSSGADDYLDKPFQLRELILRINNITKHSRFSDNTMPQGLIYNNDEFFIQSPNGDITLLGLSGEEKRLLINLTTPIGNISSATPMVAKRLRNKLNMVLSSVDIITVRTQGYKMIQKTPDTGHQKTKDL